MKKILVLLLCVVLCFSFLCGCLREDNPPDEILEPEVITLPVSQPLNFGYSSGAGGWYTSLILKPDGTFVGSFHDSEMGSVGDGHPNGTVFMAEFSGNFADIKKINNYTYSMTIDSLTVQNEGEEWLEDGIRFVVSAPYGLDGKEFVFYTPDALVEELSEEFLSWKQSDESNPAKLSVYGLYNKSTGAGFFTAE